MTAKAPAAEGGGAGEGLNHAQRRAVEHPPEAGPLIVLAGPGTGKTRVITRRIAHLINQHAAAPESIVAVTFTIKAAEQLRDRLAALVGMGVAARVNAHTFHGFGVRLLRRFGDLLDVAPMNGAGSAGVEGRAHGRSGRLRRSELMDSAQRRRMLRGIILDEDLFGHARAGGLEAIVDEAGRLFDFFDNHAKAPADIAVFVERWREAVGSDLSASEEAVAERSRLARFEDFARLHALFDAERRAAGLLTYGDQVVLPIRVLKEHPGAAARCRSEFKHWLVDEFQDVNAGQIELLRLLAPPHAASGAGAAAGPDLCVVGDDDQSIYGFRGADDRAFQLFSGVWPGATVVPLSENYRSRPRVIGVCNSIIGRADQRFAPDKKIESPAGRPADPPGVVQCVHLRDDKEDGEVIAALIRLAVSDENAKDPAGVFKRFAVVARSHADLGRVEEALWLEGIPTARAKGRSLAEEPGVQDVLAWARAVTRPREAWHARRLLLRPPLSSGMTVERVNAWVQQYRAAASRWRASQEQWGGAGRGRAGRAAPGGAEDPGSFVAWLNGVAGAEPMVAKLAAWIEQFSVAAADDTAAAWLTTVVRDAGVVNADLTDARQRGERVESIVALIRFAQERQVRLPAPGGIREFLDYYDDLAAAEQGLGRNEDEGDDADSGAADRPDAVRLTTAHSAKGLEFDTVFVPRVTPRYGYPNTDIRNELDVPPALTDADENPPDAKDRQLAEERRLFYVACTRAERRLVLLAKKNKSPSSSTHFLEELLGDESLRGQIEVLVGDEVLDQAARRSGAGMVRAGEDALRGLRTADGDGGRPVGGVKDRRRELFERARREARLGAAGALGRVDIRGVDAGEIDRAAEALRDSAERMAAIAEVEAAGRVPGWMGRMGEQSRLMIEELARAVGAPETEAPPGPSAWATRRPAPPLDLSYSAIRRYLKCPRCYYVSHVLKMSGPDGEETVLGLAMHRAMERFYARFREVDASGGQSPALEHLLALARDEFFGGVGPERELGREELDKLMAQTRLAYERLHDDTVHVLETERTIEFEYTCEGVVRKKSKKAKAERDAAVSEGPPPVSTTHRMVATLDRIDQVVMPDGAPGFRIVDYKTGEAHKYLRTPEPDDLQLGIYAMALRQEYGPDVRGWAEYWLLATGQRGRLELDQIDDARTRAEIDKAVMGVLAGEFEPARGCKAGCDILGPPG